MIVTTYLKEILIEKWSSPNRINYSGPSVEFDWICAWVDDNRDFMKRKNNLPSLIGKRANFYWDIEGCKNIIKKIVMHNLSGWMSEFHRLQFLKKYAGRKEIIWVVPEMIYAEVKKPPTQKPMDRRKLKPIKQHETQI